MKSLIELAEMISDKELRERVINFLKEPRLSHEDFKKYPRMNIEDAKSLFTISSPQGAITVERDVMKHSIALTNLLLKTVEVVEENYNIKLNKDHLIAASLLHDIMKVFEYKRVGEEIEHTGILLDHTMLAVAEFYKRGFPENVIHIIASHFGESGPTPPRNFEALIFHHCDSLLSLIEFYSAELKTKQPVQFILLDEEAIKKITGEETVKK